MGRDPLATLKGGYFTTLYRFIGFFQTIKRRSGVPRQTKATAERSNSDIQSMDYQFHIRRFMNWHGTCFISTVLQTLHPLHEVMTMIMIAIHNLILSMTILQNTTADNSIPLIKKAVRVSPIHSIKMDALLEAVFYNLTETCRDSDRAPILGIS
ncbi:MAG: hypothetical protein KDJ22_10860 [Candidatus Competibacteraceae bacterium]|nr:hypothetical protein [Candidatus Competibacteraceae bacterium]